MSGGNKASSTVVTDRQIHRESLSNEKLERQTTASMSQCTRCKPTHPISQPRRISTKRGSEHTRESTPDLRNSQERTRLFSYSARPQPRSLRKQQHNCKRTPRRQASSTLPSSGKHKEKQTVKVVRETNKHQQHDEDQKAGASLINEEGSWSSNNKWERIRELNLYTTNHPKGL